MFSAFLFDLDGTLIDTEREKIIAKHAAIAALGGAVTFQDALPLIGQSEEHVCRALLRVAGLETPWQTLSQKAEQQYLHMVRHGTAITPGAIELLEQLRQRGVPAALVTSSTRNMLRANPSVQDLLPYFGAVVHANNVERCKPHPEPYRTALQELGADASKAVAFEDSESGCASATSAGAACILRRHMFNENVYAPHALLEIETFQEILDCLPTLLS